MFGQCSSGTYHNMEYEQICVAVEHRVVKMLKEAVHVFESQRAKCACSAPPSPVVTGINTTQL